MPHRRRFPAPILWIILMVVLAGGILVWAFKLFPFPSSGIREAHTRFAISQITERLGEVGDDAFPRNPTELLAALGSADIDWNTCRIEGDGILDGWGQSIRITFDGDVWMFQSPGRDAAMGTNDDIKGVTARPPASTIPSPSP